MNPNATATNPGRIVSGGDAIKKRPRSSPQTFPLHQIAHICRHSSSPTAVVKLSIHPMPQPFPRISETEWEVLRAIWTGHPVSAAEIISRLSATDPSWHPKTARTLIARLVEKGALTYDVDGRTFLYRPLVTEEQCVAQASNSFLDRVFGGALKPMLAHFVEHRNLSPADLRDLEDLLARKKRRR